MTKVKTILVSQPKPSTERSPYFDLAEKQKIKIDFRSFIHVEGVNSKDVRAQKINFSNFTAVIFTSRNAVDNYFRLADDMRYTVPDDMRYFCQSEAVAFYLQNYVVYRKRKIYVGTRTFDDLVKLIKKHKTETFLLPSSDKLKPSIPRALDELGVKWSNATMFRTVVSDLSDLEDVFYDVLVFFSPSGIKSLFENFPGYTQKETKIAVYGNTTIKAAEEFGLTVNIAAPTKENRSMTAALASYIQMANKK